MTAKQFVMRLALINSLFLILVAALNYMIDGRSTHHLPQETTIFPRTTKHSPYSKLHYLLIKKPDTVYFGSSRVEIGLPPNPNLVGGGQVYNAGLGGTTMGQWAPFIRHTLAIAEPKQIVIGLEFYAFTSAAGPSYIDFSLFSSSTMGYLGIRIPKDIKQAFFPNETQNSIKSITAFFSGDTYDGMIEPQSYLGQTTKFAMQRLTEKRGKVDKAFQKKIEMAFREIPEDVANDKAWHIFQDLLAEMCQKNIVIRIYVHPQHALATDAIRQNGAWSRLEQWKTDLANLATRYQNQQCNVKIVDFSGYNSITTETIRGLSPTTSLQYYWEASHYKSNVGEMILKRLFSASATDVPPDFGRELRQNTVVDVLAAIREEQSRYLQSHSEDIKLAQQWVSLKTKH